MNIEIVTSESSFSWQRFIGYARYRLPAMRLYYIIVPLVSLTMGVITYVLSCFSTGLDIIASMLTSILSFLLILSPLTLAAKSNRSVETLIPSTWQEKSAYTLLSCFIVAPALVYIPYALLRYLILPLFGGETFSFSDKMYDDLSWNTKILLYAIGICSTLFFISTCMYSVMRLRNNRVGMSIVWTIVAYVAQAILTSVLTIISIFISLESFGELSDKTVPDFLHSENLIAVFTSESILFLIVAILLSWLTVRQIRKAQF